MKTRSREISIKQYLGVAIGILVLSYFLFQARFMVLGPQVTITTPKNGALVASSVVSVEGKAENAAWITLNGRQIYTDESGIWSEELMMPPGTNVVTVKTRDRFGREIEKSVQIYAN